MMVFYNVAEIFAPMQIMVVLVIALLVFGPKRLPDLGKSLGTALRELNKAKNDMMRSFSLDHEPDPEPYKSDSYASGNSYNSYNSPYHYGYNTTDTPDLTDYTIAGMPPKDAPAIEGTIARGASESNGSNGHDTATYADYTIASYTPPEASGPHSPTSAVADTHTGAVSATASADAAHKGEHNV